MIRAMQQEEKEVSPLSSPPSVRPLSCEDAYALTI